jgi:hypothetical protein
MTTLISMLHDKYMTAQQQFGGLFWQLTWWIENHRTFSCLEGNDYKVNGNIIKIM